MTFFVLPLTTQVCTKNRLRMLNLHPLNPTRAEFLFDWCGLVEHKFCHFFVHIDVENGALMQSTATIGRREPSLQAVGLGYTNGNPMIPRFPSDFKQRSCWLLIYFELVHFLRCWEKKNRWCLIQIRRGKYSLRHSWSDGRSIFFSSKGACFVFIKAQWPANTVLMYFPKGLGVEKKFSGGFVLTRTHSRVFLHGSVTAFWTTYN